MIKFSILLKFSGKSLKFVIQTLKFSSLNAFGRILVYFLEDQLTKELPESAVIPIALLSNGRLVFPIFAAKNLIHL